MPNLIIQIYFLPGSVILPIAAQPPVKATNWGYLHSLVSSLIAKSLTEILKNKYPFFQEHIFLLRLGTTTLVNYISASIFNEKLLRGQDMRQNITQSFSTVLANSFITALTSSFIPTLFSQHKLPSL